MKGYRQTTWEDLDENAIRLIGKDWMLISAGKMSTNFNMMTAAWGGLGWLWEKPVSFIFVRPQRYTFEFTEREAFYTVSFFEEKYREALNICGKKSGRNCDKVKESELSPVETPQGSIAFSQARIILECKKLYSTWINESDFIDKNVISLKYPEKDFHKMYIGEIVTVWIRE
ncbi:MAG: flavin reductase [Bacteroidota bacterium]